MAVPSWNFVGILEWSDLLHSNLVPSQLLECLVSALQLNRVIYLLLNWTDLGWKLLLQILLAVLLYWNYGAPTIAALHLGQAMPGLNLLHWKLCRFLEFH